eukprot:GDKI01031094.1.p1 GENE.GDKI01031094.1~~GDKI01031094.1.p1  ORF type:complete len:234 (-),score=24.84 GDKI01031094.1:346-1047(-)
MDGLAAAFYSVDYLGQPRELSSPRPAPYLPPLVPVQTPRADRPLAGGGAGGACADLGASPVGNVRAFAEVRLLQDECRYWRSRARVLELTCQEQEREIGVLRYHCAVLQQQQQQQPPQQQQQQQPQVIGTQQMHETLMAHRTPVPDWSMRSEGAVSDQPPLAEAADSEEPTASAPPGPSPRRQQSMSTNSKQQQQQPSSQEQTRPAPPAGPRLGKSAAASPRRQNLNATTTKD